MAYTFKHGDRPIEGITVQRAVGRGGFGEVYYALTDSGKQVAIKYLRDNPEVELRGISHVMNLKSPHLVTIYDVRHSVTGEPFVIMEYVSGPSLRELLSAAPGGLGPQKAAYFLDGIGRGLSYLHERGIVHRDLKPGNIFYDDGYVKIGDYGLSKHIAVSRHSGQTVSVGTVHYMAPEIGSGSYTRAIDIYALGVMLYEMLTGRLPFTGSSMGEILMRHLNERPDTTGIPEPFASVIARALAKDPAARYQDVNEMVDAVTGVVEIGQSLASFDHTTLSRVLRNTETLDPDRTLTRSPLPAARTLELDVHAPAAAGAAEMPPRPDEPGGRTRRQEARPERRGRRGGEKSGERLRDVLERAVVQEVKRSLFPRPGAGNAGPEAPRWPQVLTLLLATIAVAAGLGAASGLRLPDSAIALAFMLAGGVCGPLTAHFFLLKRNLLHNPLLDRVVYAGAAALAMIPGIDIAVDVSEDGHFARLAVGVLAALVICDWNHRIEEGRRLKVSAGAAFWPAVIGLVAGSITGGDEYQWIGAGLCGALSLLTQAGASIGYEPSALARGSPITMPPPIAGGEPPVEGRAVSLEDAWAGRASGGGAARPSADEAGVASAVADPGGAVSQAARLPPLPAPPWAAAGGAAEPAAGQPSFVGRASNAGLAILGKALIVLSLAAAVAMQGRFEHRAGPASFIHDDGIFTFSERGEVRAVQSLLDSFVMVPLALGTLLLLVSRRADGLAHVARGLFACLSGAVAILLVLGPAGDVIHQALIHRDPILLWPPTGPLRAALVLAGFSLLLLFWPRARRRVSRPRAN